jgi:hypothetical protein
VPTIDAPIEITELVSDVLCTDAVNPEEIEDKLF